MATTTSDQTYLRNRAIAMGVVFVVAVFALVQALLIPEPSRPTPVAPSTFPLIVTTAMLVASIGMLTEAVWKLVRARRGEEPAIADDHDGLVPAESVEEEAAGDGPNGEERVASWPRFALALGATAAYTVLFFPLGYLLATFLYVGGLSAYFWRRPVAAIALALPLTLLIGWLFRLLGIGLPAGVLPFAF